MPRKQPPAVLTVPEVAKELRVSEWNVRQRIAEGTIRALRVGSAIRVSRAELDRLLATSAK